MGKQDDGSHTSSGWFAPALPLSNPSQLALQFPQLAAEWDYSRNRVELDSLRAGSSRRVWWRCEAGHSWEAALNTRIKDGDEVRGCPQCRRLRASPEYNLTLTHPAIAAQFHPSKNRKKATEVTQGSQRRVWWRCEAGHEWRATIHSRTRAGDRARCPLCSARTTPAAPSRPDPPLGA